MDEMQAVWRKYRQELDQFRFELKFAGDHDEISGNEPGCGEVVVAVRKLPG